MGKFYKNYNVRWVDVVKLPNGIAVNEEYEMRICNYDDVSDEVILADLIKNDGETTYDYGIDIDEFKEYLYQKYGYDEYDGMEIASCNYGSLNSQDVGLYVNDLYIPDPAPSDHSDEYNEAEEYEKKYEYDVQYYGNDTYYSDYNEDDEF